MMHSSLSLAVVIVSVVFPCLALFAVSLRLYAQGLNNNGNRGHVEDYFLIAGLFVALGFAALTIYGAFEAGIGWPQNDLSPSIGIITQKVVFASQILWAASISLVRVGLLLFYRRIFVTPAFRRADSIMIGLTASWFITNLFGTIFTYSWTTTIENTINYPAWLISQAALDMVLDIATLCLPLFVIKSLQIRTRQKVLLVGIFWLGLFCVVASIFRLVYFVQLAALPEIERQFSAITTYCQIWSMIEPNTSIIAASLPAYAPLFRDGRGLKTLLRSVFSVLSLGSVSHNTTKTSKHPIDKGGQQIGVQHSDRAWQELHSASTELICDPSDTQETRVSMTSGH